MHNTNSSKIWHIIKGKNVLSKHNLIFDRLKLINSNRPTRKINISYFSAHELKIPLADIIFTVVYFLIYIKILKNELLCKILNELIFN